MVITNPQLPARAGYVEIIDSTGKHVYVPTQETIEKQEQQTQIEKQTELIRQQEEIINQLLGVTESSDESEVENNG